MGLLVKLIWLFFGGDARIDERMKLIGVKEVSEMLNVKPSTLYQWAELGQIPCIKINGALRFNMEDIKKWINSCKKNVNSDYNPLIQARGPRRGGK